MEATLVGQRRLTVGEEGDMVHEMGHLFNVDDCVATLDGGPHDGRPMWCAEDGGPCSVVTVPTAKTFCQMYYTNQDREVFKFCKQDLLAGDQCSGQNPKLPGSIRRAADPL